MTDPVTLSVGAISATKSAFELAKTILDVRDATKLQAVRFELMGLLLEAQQAEAALIGEKQQLAKRVGELEAWDGEKQRYQLAEVGTGVFAYSLKPEAQGAEPDHKLCANCFAQGQKSFLQNEARSPGMSQYLCCQACGTELLIAGFVHPEHRGAKPRKPPPAPKGGYRPF